MLLGAQVPPFADLLDAASGSFTVAGSMTMVRWYHLGAEMSNARSGGKIAQIVRGETSVLSEEETKEILEARISYYPRDTVVIG